jgi:hypothetical protein
MTSAMFIVPAVWLLKSLAYYVIFRIREIPATALTCCILGGVTFLVFLPLPGILASLAALALAVYLTMHYTGVELIPDGLFIPLGVELTAHLVLWLLSL